MARPRGPSNPAASKGRLLDAAGRRFARDGFHGASLQAIARDAGMTAPSLLHHFGSKEALFDEVLRATWRDLRLRLRPVLAADVDSETMLIEVLGTFVDYESGAESLFGEINAALLSGQGLGAAPVRDTLLPLLAAVADALRGASQGSIPDAAPVVETLTYIVLAHASQHQLQRLAPAEFERVREQEPALVLALFRGLCTTQG